MVKDWILLFFLLPVLLSAEFKASTNMNPVQAGEKFVLSLTLKDASANTPPSIDALRQLFAVHTQQQSSSTVIINGRITSSTTWKFALSTRQEGEITIPAISINTSTGVLSSDPLQIKVVRGGARKTESADGEGVSISTDISKMKPYKNEPLFCTVKLSSKHDLMNVRIQKFTIDDAAVEPNGEPKIYKKVIDGFMGNVIEFSYIITPLKAGMLKIPSIVVQGGIPERRKLDLSSLFDQDFDPFFMMSGFEQLKPFSVMSKEEVIQVMPPVAGMNPWLPAKSLKIEEIWDDSQPLQAGEPLVRGFKMVAEGITSNQLPSLNEIQSSSKDFKIYLDKPEVSDEIKGNNIMSFRNEQYTLIPQKAGTLTLPEISVTWWDVAKNEKAVAHIPARTLQILPGAESIKGPIALADEEKMPIPSIESKQQNSHMYLYMGGLAVLLCAAIFWVIALQRKISRLTEKPEKKKIAVKQVKPLILDTEWITPEKKDKKEKLPDLNPT